VRVKGMDKGYIDPISLRGDGFPGRGRNSGEQGSKPLKGILGGKEKLLRSWI